MTLEEAKEFYFQYLGYSFHMGREEPAKYSSFRMLDIDKEILQKWDEELLEELFVTMRAKPERSWSAHRDILQIIYRGNCDTAMYLTRLLDEMERMDQIDLFTATLILENMAGRTESMKDGGVYIFCKLSDLAVRMNVVTEHLIESFVANGSSDSRFNKAVRQYRKAYYTWYLSLSR